MVLYVVGAQPYDNKQLCSKSARMICYDTVNNRNGVGVGTPLICGRKHKANEYIFASGYRSKLRQEIDPKRFVRTTKQKRFTRQMYSNLQESPIF